MTQASDQLLPWTSCIGCSGQHGIGCWLFGGRAVDFHPGAVTRPPDDIDLAVWREDLDQIAALLARGKMDSRDRTGEDGYTGYERGDVRLETRVPRPEPRRVGAYAPARGSRLRREQREVV